MKVKRRLQISVTISTITVLIIILMLSMTLYHVNNAFEEKKIADEIVSSAYEKSMFSSDYLRTNNELAKQQWFSTDKPIGKLLKSAFETFKDARDKRNIDGLLKNHESIDKLFLGIVEARDKARSDPENAAIYHDTENRLYSQWSIKRYESMGYARKLQEAGNEYLSSTLLKAGLCILFIIVVVSIAVIINTLAMARVVTHQIGKLHEGVLIIGGGNLDYRIDIKGDDELADLSVAFNAMTEKIKRTEEKLKEANKQLESANKELEAFSYSVSHDLRSPLRHMHGFAGLLQKKLAGNSDEEIQSYAAVIVEASKRMETLINDLLSFSKMGRVGMKKRKMKLNDLVRKAVRDIHDETKERDIVWEIDELPDVYGDQSLLMLVIVNLISNAVKYTGTRSRAEIRIGYKEEGDEFIFSVKDNGVGFDMKQVDRLFGVFQRLHSQEEFEGTGIGLANVRRIISRHGGRTWAEGAVGQGATFYFSLPKNKS